MDNEIQELVKRLNFENLIWFSFIIISVLDIYGDEIIKKGLIENDKEKLKRANKLFLRISYFSLLIYIYFFIRNYSDYKKNNNNIYKVRLIGSILILSGTLCLVYFQKKNTESNKSISNI